MSYRKGWVHLLTTYLMLVALVVVSVMPVSAAELADSMSDVAIAAETTSEFDFSASDDINKYDAYRKQEFVTSSGNTITAVNAVATNSVYTTSEMDVNLARYGAYLRDDTEVQSYVFYNMDTQRTQTTMCNNTLTIYADPEVQFSVTDINDNLIINSNGQRSLSVVKYYNKTVDNGHDVYYIELVPGATGKTSILSD